MYKTHIMCIYARSMNEDSFDPKGDEGGRNGKS